MGKTWISALSRNALLLKYCTKFVWELNVQLDQIWGVLHRPKSFCKPISCGLIASKPIIKFFVGFLAADPFNRIGKTLHIQFLHQIHSQHSAGEERILCAWWKRTVLKIGNCEHSQQPHSTLVFFITPWFFFLCVACEAIPAIFQPVQFGCYWIGLVC